jgi:hypothetical protein
MHARVRAHVRVFPRWQEAPYFMSDTLKEAIGASTDVQPKKEAAGGDTAVVAPEDTDAGYERCRSVRGDFCVAITLLVRV